MQSLSLRTPIARRTFDKEGKPLLTVRPVVDLVSGRSIKPILGPGETGANGWKASYYSTTEVQPLLVREDLEIDFDWGTGPPNDPVFTDPDNFTVRWVGYINAAGEGEYAFKTNADDAVTLWVDGTRVIDAGCCGESSGKLTLSSGWHAAVLEYREATSFANVRLYWTPPNGSEQIIPSSSVKPGWVVSESQYDPAGNLIRAIDAEGRVTKNDYDGNNRLTATTDPANSKTSYKYYSSTETSPCNSPITWMSGLLCTKTMPGGGLTTYMYFDGELYSETGNAALQNVRQTGFLKSVIDPQTVPPLATIACHEQVTSCNHYDWLGNKIHSRNAKGDFYFALDLDNRVVKAQFPPEPPANGFSGTDGATFTGNPAFNDSTKYVLYEYDEDGNRTKLIDPTVDSDPNTAGVQADLTEDKYDDLNRFFWSKDALLTTGPVTATVYSYDANNFVTQTVSPAGTKNFTPSSDGLDRVASMSDTQNKTFTFNYDDEGRLTRSNYPNTTHVDYHYCGQGELISQHNAQAASHGSSETLMSAFSSSYDSSGKKTSEAGPSGRMSYLNDPAGRLEGVVDASKVDSYYYDPNSNRTKMVKGANALGFSAVASASWINLGGVWRITSDEVKQTDEAIRNKLVFAQDFPQDVTVEAKVKFPSSMPPGLAGIIFRQNANSSGTYYAVRLDQRDNTAQVVIDSQVYSTPFTITPGTWYTLKAVMSGSNLDFFIDGALKLSRSDLPGTPSNYMGLKTSLAEARFDDFTVKVGSQTSEAVRSGFGAIVGAGDWGYEEGALAQTSTALSQMTMASSPIPTLINAYTISSRIKVSYDPSKRKHAGLVVDWDPAQSRGYRIDYLAPEPGQPGAAVWEIYRFDSAGSYALLGSYTDTNQALSPAAGWQSVSVSRNRSSGAIDLYVNSKQLLSVFDTNIVSGGSGLFSYGSKTLFRDTRTSWAGTTSNYTHNPADQLASGPVGAYCYGATGSLESYRSSSNICSPNTGWQENDETRFEFDTRDRLRRATKLTGANPTWDVNYTRDGLDRVIKRTEQGAAEIRLHYESGSDSVAFETDSTNAINRKMISGPPGLLVDYKGATFTPSYAYFNGHGDLVNTASDAGAVTATYRQDPFGNQISINETVADTSVLKNRYVGKWQRELDATTGLILMGARPYDPTIGRFLSKDPVEGGSANDYDYANQDCVNQYDLDGKAAVDRWYNRYNKCLTTYRKLTRVYKSMMAVGSAGVVAEASNHYEHGKLNKMPFYRNLPRGYRVASRAAGVVLASTFVIGAGGYIGQSLYCEYAALRGRTS